MMFVGKWSLEGKGQGKRRNPFFFSGGPKDAGQRKKKKEGVGGVSGGRR